MFNVQKCLYNHEIYINYNEYLEEDDECIPVLEHMIEKDDVKEFSGIIDLITVKNLSNKEKRRIKQIHDILVKGKIIKLNVISDNVRVLKRVKKIIPDVSTKLLKLH